MTLADFGELAQKDETIDIELDRRTVEVARQKDEIILDGRLAGAMLALEKILAFKVWIDAPISVRAERTVKRDGGDVAEAEKAIIKRHECELDRYKAIHDIDMADLSIYDLIINSASMSPNEIVEKIIDKFEATKDYEGGQ